MKLNEFTVCLINYARPWNLPIICDRLIEYGFDDIIVFDQGADTRVKLDELLSEDVRILDATGENVFTLGRHLAALRSDRPYIATVDDDYLVLKDGWDQLIDRFDGKKACCQLPMTYGKFSLAYHLPWVCLGYGSVYPRSLVEEFYTNWIQAYGADEMLATKADRAFTSYIGEWDALKSEIGVHHSPLSNPSGQRSESDDSAIHRRDDHWERTTKAVDMGMRLRLSDSLKTPSVLTFLTPSIN